jgi:hypothetical protein
VNTDESFCAGKVAAVAEEEQRRRAAESAMGDLLALGTEDPLLRRWLPPSPDPADLHTLLPLPAQATSRLHDFAFSRRVLPSTAGGGFHEGRGSTARQRLLPPLGGQRNWHRRGMRAAAGGPKPIC